MNKIKIIHETDTQIIEWELHETFDEQLDVEYPTPRLSPFATSALPWIDVEDTISPSRRYDRAAHFQIRAALKPQENGVFYTMRTTEKNPLKIKKYIHKRPYSAVKVTKRNIEKVAAWTNGVYVPASTKRGIMEHVEINSWLKVFAGQYVLKYEEEGVVDFVVRDTKPSEEDELDD